jgi:hypothetical protein
MRKVVVAGKRLRGERGQGESRDIRLGLGQLLRIVSPR